MDQIKHSICKKEPDYTLLESRHPGAVQAKAFIQACLEKDAFDRPTARELLKFAWLRKQPTLAIIREESDPQVSSVLKPKRISGSE